MQQSLNSASRSNKMPAMRNEASAAPQTGRRRSVRSAAATSERILDAAEQLFASRGFFGASLREITGAAGVDLALANYHFGSKEQLFEAVLMRRAEILNRERLELLDKARRDAAPAAPSAEAIIDAFTHPLLNRSARGGAGWKAYFALVAQANNSPRWGGAVITKYFDPVVDKFIAALRETLPGCDARDLYWSYHFLSGALTLTFAETGRIDKLSRGLCRSSDLDSVHERLVPFFADGFRGLYERARRARAERERRVVRARNGDARASRRTR
jgi:AcrR family transcriptional regulator